MYYVSICYVLHKYYDTLISTQVVMCVLSLSSKSTQFDESCM
jgi:hypothetical protein